MIKRKRFIKFTIVTKDYWIMRNIGSKQLQPIAERSHLTQSGP